MQCCFRGHFPLELGPGGQQIVWLRAFRNHPGCRSALVLDLDSSQRARNVSWYSTWSQCLLMSSQTT